MKTLTARFFLAAIFIGTFSLLAFGQTQLKLSGIATSAEGQLGGKNGSTANYTINLPKDSLACVLVRSEMSALTATFDGKAVGVNQEDKSCFELSEARSYSIRVNAGSERDSGTFGFELISTGLLKMVNNRLSSTGSLNAKESKHFSIKLVAGKSVCMAANSNDLQSMNATIVNLTVPVSFKQAKGTPACVGYPTDGTYWSVNIYNQTNSAGTYSFIIAFK